MQAEDPLTTGVSITHGEVLLALSSGNDDAEALFDEAAAIAEAREARMVQR